MSIKIYFPNKHSIENDIKWIARGSFGSSYAQMCRILLLQLVYILRCRMQQAEYLLSSCFFFVLVQYIMDIVVPTIGT